MCGQLTPLTRDFHRLLKNVKKLTDNQVQIVDYDDDISEFTIEIKPSDGFYKRGKFEFRIKLQNYPNQAPDVRTLTDIYHPNINTIRDDGDICLSLFDEWEPSNDLEDCVQGLLYLIYNPNLEDPLNPNFDSTDVEQMERFADDVKISLQGGNVDGFDYERNIVDDNTDEIVEGNTNNEQNDSEVELAEEVHATEASTALQATTQTTAIETTVETTTELTTRVPTTTLATTATTATTTQTTVIETTVQTTTKLTTTAPTTATTTIPSTMLATTQIPATPTATATTTTTPPETTRMILTTTETTTTTIASTPTITTLERTNKLDANPEKNENAKLTNCNGNVTGFTINNLNEKLENKEMEKKNFDKNATHVHTDITNFNGNIHVQFKPRGTFPQYYYWNA